MTDTVDKRAFHVHAIKLDSTLAEAFLAFARKVSQEDQTPPFSEQTLVEVQKISHGAAQVPPLLCVSATDSAKAGEGQWLGAAVALLDENQQATVEGAVLPSARSQGIGRALGEALHQELAQTQAAEIHLWVHQIQGEEAVSERKAAEILARSFDYTPVRELRKMQLELTEEARQSIQHDYAQLSLPEGITLETFAPGQDEQAWVDANAAAFAHHPEQGNLTLLDLQERKVSDWFRAAGFFLARSAEGLAGFHWTKIPADQGEELEGEVYAVGIVPSWQGKKLGRVITLAGMDYLARWTSDDGRALHKIVLYVDADNTAAVSLYKSLGFVEETVDIMYSNQA